MAVFKNADSEGHHQVWCKHIPDFKPGAWACDAADCGCTDQQSHEELASDARTKREAYDHTGVLKGPQSAASDEAGCRRATGYRRTLDGKKNQQTLAAARARLPASAAAGIPSLAGDAVGAGVYSKFHPSARGGGRPARAQSEYKLNGGAWNPAAKAYDRPRGAARPRVHGSPDEEIADLILPASVWSTAMQEATGSPVSPARALELSRVAKWPAYFATRLRTASMQARNCREVDLTDLEARLVLRRYGQREQCFVDPREAGASAASVSAATPPSGSILLANQRRADRPRLNPGPCPQLFGLEMFSGDGTGDVDGPVSALFRFAKQTNETRDAVLALRGAERGMQLEGAVQLVATVDMASACRPGYIQRHQLFKVSDTELSRVRSHHAATSCCAEPLPLSHCHCAAQDCVVVHGYGYVGEDFAFGHITSPATEADARQALEDMIEYKVRGRRSLSHLSLELHEHSPLCVFGCRMAAPQVDRWTV